MEKSLESESSDPSRKVVLEKEWCDMTRPVGPPYKDESLTISLWPEAGRALGIGRSTTYELVQRGEFPVRVLRLGTKMRVSKVELMRYVNGPSEAA